MAGNELLSMFLLFFRLSRVSFIFLVMRLNAEKTGGIFILVRMNKMDIQVPFLYFPGPFFQLPERWDDATHHEGGKNPADKENEEKQGDINGGDGLFKKPVYLHLPGCIPWLRYGR